MPKQLSKLPLLIHVYLYYSFVIVEYLYQLGRLDSVCTKWELLHKDGCLLLLLNAQKPQTHELDVETFPDDAPFSQDEGHLFDHWLFYGSDSLVGPGIYRRGEKWIPIFFIEIIATCVFCTSSNFQSAGNDIILTKNKRHILQMSMESA